VADQAFVQFSVNGQAVEIALDADTSLVHILRNDLKLKGTRFGCGTGNCGSCTVLVDDQPVQSCDIPLWSLAGKHVTTIEGLGNAASPHPIQASFIDEQAAQCGYCINGMMMTLAGLLKKQVIHLTRNCSPHWTDTSADAVRICEFLMLHGERLLHSRKPEHEQRSNKRMD